MSVIVAMTLPGQPILGSSVYLALGGDGRVAPMGCYFVRLEVAGDASGGNAIVTINLDERYTNLVAYANALIAVDAAAGDFSILVQEAGAAPGPGAPHIVGTIPQIATGVTTDNASFLWYPPPVYFQGGGQVTVSYPNVGVGETYKLQIEVYVFDINVRRITPLPVLQMNVPGVSAPAAV